MYIISYNNLYVLEERDSSIQYNTTKHPLQFVVLDILFATSTNTELFFTE